MRLAAQHIHDARGWIGTPVELEHEAREVRNNADAYFLQHAIALCWLTALVSASMTAPEQLALENGLRELAAAYDRIGYVREAAYVGDRYFRAREQLGYNGDALRYTGSAEIEPLWPEDAECLAVYLRQRGCDVEVGRSDRNGWDVGGLYYVRATTPTDD